MKASGQPARLAPYDTDATVEPGDYIRTGTGRTYLVTEARLATRGRHAGYRWTLQTIVMAPDHQVEDDAVVHPLHWYRR